MVRSNHSLAPYLPELSVRIVPATTIDDAVQGAVTVQNAEIDDYVLLRADGTPTYMLAVVVDDFNGDGTNDVAEARLYVDGALEPVHSAAPKLFDVGS